ncbi:hypothetical protein FRB90_008968 [Tulasnella sp. 427]|nr:hypothetical protein FRB90_008968 [Tulasnella sp. 427]
MSTTPGSARKTLNDAGMKDSSLAEWTSEIRKLQSEVDREAEEETKRLQEEIAKSRLARERRRQSNRRSGPNVGDPSTLGSVVNRMKDDSENDMLSIIDKQRNQSDALKKLIGTNNVVVASTAALASQRAPVKAGEQGTSLAAFIGGRASGPKLTRHAPQADVKLEDLPAAYRPDSGMKPPTAIPSGVALPGLSKPKASTVGGGLGAQTPPPTIAQRAASLPIAEPAKEPSPKPFVQPAQPTPAFSSNPKPVVSAPQELTQKDNVPAKPEVAAPSTPTKPTRFTASPYSPPSSASTPKINTPTSPPGGHKVSSPPPLARPISVSPATPPTSFQLPQGGNPSPAFLRPLPQKELTPSLTRLQGRGFVAKSVQGGGVPRTIPEAPPSPEKKVTPSPSGKKISVLDRWPAVVITPSSSKPDLAPKSLPNKLPGRETFGASPTSSPSMPIIRPAPVSRRSIEEVPVTQPNRSDSPQAKPFALPGLASSRPQVKEPAAVEEKAIPEPRPAPSQQPSAPLVHPTKGRAKKPKKTTSSSNRPVAQQQDAQESESLIDQPIEKETSVELIPPSTGVVLPLTPPNSLPRHFSPPQQPASPVAEEPVSSPPAVASPKPTPSLPPRSSAKTSDSASSGGPSVAQLKEAWGTNKPIAAREVGPIAAARQSESPSSNGSSFRRALPGLSSTDKGQVTPSPADEAGSRRRSVMEIAKGMAEAQPSPVQTTSSRITSTPSPAPAPAPAEEAEASTPIDVRSAIANWGKSNTPSAKPSTPGPVELPKSGADEEEAGESQPIDVKSAIASWGRAPTSPPVASSSPSPRPTPGARDPVKAERRRSQLHEKYASMILPPLAEEKTPAPTPVGTLRREPSEVKTDDSDADAATPTTEGTGHRKQPSAFQMHQALLEHKALVQLVDHSPDGSPAAPPPTSLPFSESEPIIRLAIEDASGETEPYDLSSISRAENPIALPDDATTISVEVLVVSGNTTTPITTDLHIFYDVEVRAIVHRFKSKASGLVTTRVFGWRGRQAEVGAIEAKKLGDLATRFGTSLLPCIQGSEPVELVRILGNVLVTRQGPRAHWSRENTAMHCVRQVQDVIYIDQVEPERKNLCSAFSYVCTVLDAVYVFQGRGASPKEREQAIRYAQTLCAPEATPIEFEEDAEDEMFSMVLGGEEHAKADFWRFRNVVDDCLVRLYRVHSASQPKVQLLNEVAAECIDPSAVFVLDGTFELFVIVGAEARGQRADIKIAISVAQVRITAPSKRASVDR